MANERNVKEVGVFLENEIIKARKMGEDKSAAPSDIKASAGEKPSGTATASLGATSTNEYRYLLIKCINRVTQQYPSTIPQLIGPLMSSFLIFEKKGSMASLETIIFIREVVEVYPEHRQTILQKLFTMIDQIKNHLVIRVAVWIIGEYSLNQQEIDEAFDSLKRNIGSLPIHPDVNEEEKKNQAADKSEEKQGPKIITKTIILPDGSYGTETIIVDDGSAQNNQNDEDQIPLRKALKNSDDDFLASCIAISLTKLAIKSKKNLNIKKFNTISLESSLIICALLKGKKKGMDINNVQRMQLCLKILTNP